MSITSVINDTVTSVSLVNAQKPLPPTISGYSVGGLDDTALDPAGGQTVQINGTGFLPGATITFDGSAVAVVTFSSANRLTFTSPAKSAGTYTIYVVNPDGGTAIYIPGVIYSLLPTWTTGAGTLGSYYETTSISNTVVASGDAPITYSLYSGSLPTGSTLSSGGVITGTAPVDNSSTTYSFTIEAIDAQLQSSTRSFSLTINTDVVTWITPESNATYTLSANSAISNVTLSATDAAGYGIVYTANSLPTGLSLSGNTISGTPTVIADSSTLLTATAATTNRTATRTINWSITVANDPYFEYNTLLIPGASTTFVDDASTNNFAVTINGDTKPNSMNPYSPGYYSNYFDGTGDYLTLPDNTAFDFPGDFTVEAWVYLNTVTGSQGVYSSIDNGADSWVGVTLSFSGTSFLATSYISGNDTITHQTAVTAGQWYHIAIVRNGSSTKSYLNGVQSTTTTSGTYSLTQSGGTIGSAYPGSSPLNGYISNLRVVKGTAVYTSSFTPSTAPLTAISGTSLLTCQSNRFIDNSTNAFTITVTGDTSIKSFQPFTPNSSYSTYGSAYSDGNGDYIAVADNSNLAFGTGDYTIEMWVYLISYAQSSFWESNPFGTTGQRPNGFIWYQASGVVYVFFNGSNFLISSANVIPLAQWAHIALVRNSGATAFYVNGVNVAAASTTYNSTNGAGIVGAFCDGGTYSINGYISNLRAVKGTAVYTSNFTPPSAPLTAIANTQLLTLQNNQSVNNSVFLDNSSNNFLVTRAGNTTQGTFSPYGGNWSNYFDGTGDWLSVASNAAFGMGTGNCTIELWYFPLNSTIGTQALIDLRTTNTAVPIALGVLGTGAPYAYNGTVNSGGTVSNNAWNHIAFVRNGSGTNNCKLYLNGTQVVQFTDANDWGSADSCSIGRNTAFDGEYAYGYFSNVRIVKGTAVYTSAFTPPTTPLTVISGTSLLTCQSNRLIDSSINNFTITKNGDTSVQRFSPFNPASVTPTSYSGYFDGTGDYLSIADSTNIQPGSGDLTYEFWWYPTTFAPSYQEILTKGTGLQIYAQSAGPYLVVALSADNSGSYFINNGPSTALSTNTWYHIAVTRSGNNYYVYLNGVQTLLGTSASSIGTGTDALLIGAYKGPLYYTTGYISNVRFVKGTAVYTSNFTPPTSPLTAISGTQLLTCQSTTFIDNSTNNFTITANGNSQPSIQNPFGYTSALTNGYSVSTIGGSGYFDGTGDYLLTPSSTNLVIGTGNFAVEAWIYPTAYDNYNGYLSTISGQSTPQGISMSYDEGWLGSTTVNVTYAWASLLTLNAWNHIAITREGTTVRWFVNGILRNTATSSLNLTSSTAIIGGRYYNGTYLAKGYISDARIVSGSAVYTSSFVPPSQPLTAITNTALLTNMTSAGIYDAAMMNDMETLGDAKLSTAVSKFGGSSMYFDGTGDSFKGISASPSFQFGTGDFTVECWVYTSNLSSYQTIIDTRSADTQSAYGLFINNSAFPAWYDASGFATSSVAVSSNTWTHVAVSRSSGTLKVFVNGTSGYSGSNTNAQNPTGNIVVGMNISGSAPYNGYIDDLRITKGYARYTSNFTAPTSAFPIY